MYTTIGGIYENGQITLQEAAPTNNKMRVLITFIEESIALPNQTTLKALQAADCGEYETVSLAELKQQWDEA